MIASDTQALRLGRWHRPVALPTIEAETEGQQVQGHPGQLSEPLSQD